MELYGEADCDTVREEIGALQRHRSSFIVDLLAAFEHTNAEGEQRYIIVTELCDSDLEKYIRQHTPLSEEQIWSLFAGCIAGVYQLHVNDALHEDIKPSNVLVKDGCVKLADLGKAVPDHSTSTLQSNGGAMAYASPEKINPLQFDKKADVWALGCVLVSRQPHLYVLR